MTPAARLSAAIDILDQILAGDPASLTLTNWGRQSRFAGSRDRAAVRDIVYDCLRCRRSYGAPFSGESGRALVLSYASEKLENWADLFTGQGYDPAEVTDDEANALSAPAAMADAVRLNYPDFLDDAFKSSLGPDFEDVMQAMLTRAPVDLRVNSAKGTVAEAIAMLAMDEIDVEPVVEVPTALRVTRNPRRVAQSKAYQRGFIELQDASSQAVTLFSDAKPGMQVLDYCAGGGGKSLALYDMIDGRGQVVAHDIASVRMNDLPARAARANARITIAQTGHPKLKTGAFDLVFVDAPCSGTGSWRRTPDAKWRISEWDLINLDTVQAEILRNSVNYLKPGGKLIYATCSLLARENADRVAAFCDENGAYRIERSVQFTPKDIGDGFFAACIVAT